MSPAEGNRFGGRWLSAAVRSFLFKPLPERVGWAHVLGGGALFLLFLQALTGLLLAFNYDPSPGLAHASVDFLTRAVPFGKIIRGIHHWGTTLLIVVVVVHLLRVFLFAAYKPPRQYLWISGVALFLVILGMGFTGSLLPWTQHSYWATVVGTKVVGSLPVVGPLMLTLLRGGNEVGAPTLTRFYILHILILPWLLVALIFAHLYLLRRHGITAPWAERESEVPRTVPFFPFQTAKDLFFMCILLGALLILVFWEGVPLEAVADPSDASYVPRPEWYFLPLFQLLKLKVFWGRMEFVGGVLIPLAIFLALFLVPWIDRNPSRLPRRRVAELSIVATLVLAAAALGAKAYRETPREPSGVKSRGEQLFAGLRCGSCHAIGTESKLERVAPRFMAGKSQRDQDWLASFLVNPAGFFPGTEMPRTRLGGEDLDALVDYVSQFRVDQAGRAGALPSARACASCHRRQFEEWKNSFHARSLGPTFRGMFTVFTYNTGGKSPEFCLNCHAPEVKLKGNVKELAERLLAGQEVTSEGINCATCHALKEAPERPDPALESVSFDLKPVEDHLANQTKLLSPFFRSAHFCGTCHDYNANVGPIRGPACCTVVRGWEKTAFPHKGITCQSCHMQRTMEVIRAENEPASHRLPGPRDEDFLKKAVTMSIRAMLRGGSVEVTIALRNKAGHNIPDG